MILRNFDICKKIIDGGNSDIFEDWKNHAPITKEDFLEALKWLSEDPCDGGQRKCKMTREVGLTPFGIVRLKRTYGVDDFCTIRYEDGFLWGGATFRVPCDNPDFADKDGTCLVNFKISLSCMDRV